MLNRFVECDRFGNNKKLKKEKKKRMNGIARYVLAGGLIVASAQFLAGPVANWHARREGSLVRVFCFFFFVVL